MNRDDMFSLSLKMDDKTLLNLCIADRNFNEKICKNDNFWKSRLNIRYPFLIEYKKENETWKNFYLKMFHYISLLEENYEIPYIPAEGYNPEDFYKLMSLYDKNYAIDKAAAWAALAGNLDILKNMIKKGAIQIQHYLSYASEEGHLDVVEYLKSIM